MNCHYFLQVVHHRRFRQYCFHLFQILGDGRWNEVQHFQKTNHLRDRSRPENHYHRRKFSIFSIFCLRFTCAYKSFFFLTTEIEMKGDDIVLSFLKIDSIFTYNRWRENFRREIVRIYLYSIYMQVLLTVNKFSTNRRRLIVKQTTTTFAMCDVCDIISLDYVMPHLDPKFHDVSQYEVIAGKIFVVVIM